MNSLLTLLKYYVQPAPEVLSQVATTLRKVRYSKGNILLQPGDISDKFYFVETGILREFFTWNNTGEEHTTQLVTEATFFCSALSFLHGIPSERVLEVLEDCTLITIKKNDMEYWCDKVPGMEHFLRTMLGQALCLSGRARQNSEKRAH